MSNLEYVTIKPCRGCGELTDTDELDLDGYCKFCE